MSKEICHQACPECGAFIRVIAQNVNVTLEKQTVRDLPDKPPAVGDWAIHTEDAEPQPKKIYGIHGDRVYVEPHDLHKNISLRKWWGDTYTKVVRRSDAPLQKGDHGLLDGKIKVWVATGGLYFGNLTVVFNTKTMGVVHSVDAEKAFIRPDRFTLTEPVYPDGGKLSGNEKED